MTEATRTSFRAAALASRLLTQEQIDEALTALEVERAPSRETPVEADEQRLAAKLVEVGRLNRWQADQLLAGQTKFNLGPYQIIDSIGQGGMGQVFKAEHTLMGRVVAVKVLPKSKSSPEATAGFAHEIRAQAQLDHANLVRAYDAGHDGNVYYLVTEYVPGTDLRQLVLQRGRLNQREAATIISQAARGLEHAHSRGLIHRDAKPGNVLVTPDGHAKLSDLGLAGFLSDDPDPAHEDPRAGRIVGTADYLAPELIASPRRSSPASDVYSLGCTLYYAVTGKVPFPGGTTRDKCYRHCHETPLHPRRFNPELSNEFLDVLADMMEKDPARRIGTAAEVVRRLTTWTDEAIAPLPRTSDYYARAASPSAAIPFTESPRPSDSAQSFPDFPDISSNRRDTPSQASQGTAPVVAAAEETSPMIRPQSGAANSSQSQHTQSLLPLLAPAGLVLLAVVILILFLAFNFLH